MACSCGPGQQCDPLKPGCRGYRHEHAEAFDLPTFPPKLTAVAVAIWEVYPEALPAWGDLPECGVVHIPGRADFRTMARAALDAAGVTIDD